MRKRFVDFLLRRSFWAVELYSSLTKIIWGILFFTGGIKGDAKPFTVMGQLMPREYVWGLFFLVIGSLHVRALFSQSGRETQANISVFVWTWIAIVLGFSRGYAGFLVYGLLALFCGFAALRLKLLKKAGVLDD